MGGIAQQHGRAAAPASQRPPGEQAPARGLRHGAEHLGDRRVPAGERLEVRAVLGGLHPGRRRPVPWRVDHGQEVDQAAAVDRVVQQVRAGPDPELQGAGIGQPGQQVDRDQAAEPGRARVDRLVPAGHPVPDQRVHAVRAHHQAGLEDGARRAAHPHPRAAFLQGFDAAVQVQVVGPERIGEDPLQGRPVQAEERRAERVPVPLRTGRDGDPVTVAAVAVDERGGLGRDLRQGFTQAEVPHTPGSRWPRARPPRPPHAARWTAPGPRRRYRAAAAAGPGQPADPRSDDHDRRVTGHRVSSRHGRAGSVRLCIVTGAGSGRPTAGLPLTYRAGTG